jgi:hypothetical protein
MLLCYLKLLQTIIGCSLLSTEIRAIFPSSIRSTITAILEISLTDKHLISLSWPRCQGFTAEYSFNKTYGHSITVQPCFCKQVYNISIQSHTLKWLLRYEIVTYGIYYLFWSIQLA